MYLTFLFLFSVISPLAVISVPFPLLFSFGGRTVIILDNIGEELKLLPSLLFQPPVYYVGYHQDEFGHHNSPFLPYLCYNLYKFVFGKKLGYTMGFNPNGGFNDLFVLNLFEPPPKEGHMQQGEPRQRQRRHVQRRRQKQQKRQRFELFSNIVKNYDRPTTKVE